MSQSPPEKARTTRAEKPRGGPVRLGIDQQTLAWLRPHATALMQVEGCDWRNDPAAALRAALGEPAGKARHAVIDIVAGVDLALHWLQTPPGSLASFEELRLVAQARCAHLHGGTPADWWVTGDWHASRPFACAALPTAVTQPLAQALAAWGATPRWHTAWGLACANAPQAFAANGWNALRSPQQVMLWHCSGGQVDGMATLAASPQENSPSAADRALQQVRIEASRAQHLAPGTLHWLDLTAARDTAAPAGTQAVTLPLLARSASPPSTEADAALALSALLEGSAA